MSLLVVSWWSGRGRGPKPLIDVTTNDMTSEELWPKETWKQSVLAALRAMDIGDGVALFDLYPAVANRRVAAGYPLPRSTRAIVRRTVQELRDEGDVISFGDGIWGVERHDDA